MKYLYKLTFLSCFNKIYKYLFFCFILFWLLLVTSCLLPSLRNILISFLENIKFILKPGSDSLNIVKWDNLIYTIGINTFIYGIIFIILILISNEIFINNILFCCIISGVISILLSIFFLGLYNIDLNVPFFYHGDAFSGLTIAQNYITGNGRYIFSYMGAPGFVDVSNVPDSSTLNNLIMWFLSLFINSSGLLVNIFYLLTFFTISITTTISLRLLKINPITSIFGGVLYSLLPYHFYRGVWQLFLSSYSLIPLSCVLILNIMNGNFNFFNNKNINNNSLKNNIFNLFSKNVIIAFIIAILIGFDNSYYILFSVYGIIFAIFWNFLVDKNIKKTISSSIFLIITIISILINIFPYISNILNETTISTSYSRGTKDIELTALKFLPMILPTQDHRIPIFAEIRNIYNNRIAVNFHEGPSSSIGIFISIGLIMSLYLAMIKNKYVSINIKNSSIINIFIILLGCSGGFSSLIAFFFITARWYSRLNILIAFFSLYIILYYIDYIIIIFNKKNLDKMLIFFLLIFIFSFSLLDIVSSKSKIVNDYDKYYSDIDFIKRIENITPNNSMVFQLPYIPETHLGNFKNIRLYEQFTPFVHSKTLKWSYRAQQNSPADRWQSLISNYPLDIMLKHLACVGFNGLYIDKNGYEQDEYYILRNDIISITGVFPITSNNNRLDYFYLGEYFSELKNNLNQYDYHYYSNWEKYKLIIEPDIDVIYNVSNNFGDLCANGWTELQPWGIWSDGNIATIEFSILKEEDIILYLDFLVFSHKTNINVFINGIDLNLNIVNDKNHITIPIKKEYLENINDIYHATVQFNINKPQSPIQNLRKLGIGLYSFSIAKQ
jgi:phosphoglycerol transferase